MKPSSNAIRLDPRRLGQLKTLAVALSTTNAGAIGEMIREKIAAGAIPADIPGIIVRPVDSGVSIKIDDAEPFTYSGDVARQIADTMDDVAAGGAGVISVDHNFSVVRQGTGIKISLPLSGANALPFKLAPAFPADLVRDFADLIRQAAA